MVQVGDKRVDRLRMPSRRKPLQLGNAGGNVRICKEFGSICPGRRLLSCRYTRPLVGSRIHALCDKVLDKAFLLGVQRHCGNLIP
jgi:hypothetical protein